MIDLFNIKDLTIIVTGAARGNGKAISEYLYKNGANVIAIDKKKIEIKQNIKSENYFEKYHCDLSKYSDTDSVSKKILKKHRKIDVLINNAGITLPNKNDLKNFEKTFQVNLMAPYILIKNVSKVMQKYNKGSIINITSLSQSMAFSNNPSYNSSKSALAMLSYSFALDLGKHNIRVNNIIPGYIRTDMTKMSYKNKKLNKIRNDRNMLGRWGESTDLIGAVIFLSTDSSSYVTSSNIYVDGGFSKKGI